MTNPSVIAPVGMALETVRRVLFQQFNLVKWLAIGFTAWLAGLEEQLGSGLNLHTGQWEKEEASRFGQAAWAWIMAHLFIVIPVLILLVVIGLVVSVLVIWLSCRGKFMFLDNVVANRAEIIAPWHGFRAQGNSCFLFTICFSLALAAVLILGLGLALLVSWPDISRSHFGWYAAGAIGMAIVFFICFLITAVCARAFFEDFVIPIMALKKCRVMEGWSIFFDLFRKQAGIFILYLLFRTALSIIIAFITLFLCCLLCCTVLIPYVGTVILLPVFVFWRSYSVHFLGQFSDSLKMFEGAGSSYITLDPVKPY